jgi:hypothetical protein
MYRILLRVLLRLMSWVIHPEDMTHLINEDPNIFPFGFRFIQLPYIVRLENGQNLNLISLMRFIQNSFGQRTILSENDTKLTPTMVV